MPARQAHTSFGIHSPTGAVPGKGSRVELPESATRDSRILGISPLLLRRFASSSSVEMTGSQRSFAFEDPKYLQVCCSPAFLSEEWTVQRAVGSKVRDCLFRERFSAKKTWVEGAVETGGKWRSW